MIYSKKSNFKEYFKYQNPVRHFFTALEFLTIIPTPSWFKRRAKLKADFSVEIAESTPFFPFVGFIIGVLLFLIYLIFNRFPCEITSVLVLGGWICITGALHLDGLADTIDGLSGGNTREKVLDIMRDSHIGAKGVAGVILLILLKLFLLAHILSYSKPFALVYIPSVSRWGMVIGAFIIPYAREEGLGKFSLFIGYPQIIMATLITLILGIIILGILHLILIAGVGTTTVIFSLYLKKKIGGFTGDTLGALGEIGEVVSLFLVSLLYLT
ncbi:adenosylcobinamide-GDP ribazoletransferase [Candidatus Aerophobetes bacterium]|nr:adenosylcobinamide-GDP ribazoletransferase [Candidatus Aerophobetes bacterium]